MTTRITGLVSGLDVDALVEAGTSYYQGKLDEAKQKQQKLQWEQTAYQSIATDATTFYNKYLDITSNDCITTSSNWNINTYTSSNASVVTATGGSGTPLDNYTVSVTSLASAAKGVLPTSTGYAQDLTITVSGQSVTIKAADLATAKSSSTTTDGQQQAIASLINSSISSLGATATYSAISGGIVLSTTTMGGDQTLAVSDPSGPLLTDSSGTTVNSVSGSYLNATISNSTGSYSITNGTSNTQTLDNITFSFNGKTNTSGTNVPVTLTGSSDVSDVEKRIESFVNDYNTLIGQINTQYYTSYNIDYQPLTDAEKKSMSASDISAWNAQAQTGLLYGDDNLDKLASQMKDAMSTFMTSSGVDLESFGITPVEDYSTQNGVYTIDSDKLKAALEDPTKFSQIQSLFCNGSSNITSLTTSNSSTDGIAAKLKVALNVNVTTPTSILSQLCGTNNNPVTLTTNEFYQELQDQSNIITNYQNELSDQETALYNKYSQLESQLTQLQSSSSVFSSSSK